MTVPSGLPQGKPIHVEPLETPIQAYGAKLTELRIMRRVTAGDIVWLQKNSLEESEGTLHLLFRLTGVPVADLETLDAFDFTKIDRVIASFLHRGPTTGKTDSPPSGGSSAPA